MIIAAMLMQREVIWALMMSQGIDGTFNAAHNVLSADPHFLLFKLHAAADSSARCCFYTMLVRSLV